MKILAIDLSTKPGVALLDGERPLFHTTLFNDLTKRDFGTYPENMLKMTYYVINKLTNLTHKLISEHGRPDLIVIEETVPGRETYSQKQLEWLHFWLCQKLIGEFQIVPKYIRTGDWRKTLNMRLSKEDKKNNQLVSKGKKRGRIGKKHLSVRMANARWNLSLKIKDEDAADALNLGLAAYMGAPFSTGEIIKKNS
jgi:hypothetical protein